METSSELQPDSEPATPTTTTLRTSSEFLRFPVPATDARISTWVEHLNTTNMSSTRGEALFDEGSLGESAYEFIDTDEESRDDNATESVASTDFGRPDDDVASLADTEQSGEESEDDIPVALSTPALPGAEHAVEEAFNTPTIGRSSAMFLEELEKPQMQSIEFEEPFNLGAETVSVKHTVAELDEEKTAVTARKMMLQNSPKRLAVTIRQTMTKQGLTTRDPLRILYVGSHSAKQDIIHKIASSVTASVGSDKRQQIRQSTSQLYNVVPVSAFGSERTPEIELMHSSGYQIKVEDCTYAQALKFEDEPTKSNVIKLTLDDNFAYHSVPEGDGFIVEPHWELPHVAIVYCSDSDDLDARRTRTIARQFMSRHYIPSIVISHKQIADRGQCMALDQHSIHMCLESRDPAGRGNIIHQRMPIDLTSFLNIDARQMNRNLAYLTGLHEPLDIKASPAVARNIVTNKNQQNLEKPVVFRLTDIFNYIRNQPGPVLWRAAAIFAVTLLGALGSYHTGATRSRELGSPAISVNSKIVSAVPISSTASLTSISTVPSVTSAPTSVAIKTQTQTVTVTQSIAFAPGPNSLAVLPSMELGKAAKLASSTAKSTNNKTSICTAEMLGDREILIRAPSAMKVSWLNWLTKEALIVNITRDNVTVDVERVSTSDEGIILLLPQKEAYGLLNISIVTKKKPRVNETFQVDFGFTPAQRLQSYMNMLTDLIPADATDPQFFARMKETVMNKVEDTITRPQEVLVQLEETGRLMMDKAAAAGSSLTEIAKAASLEAAKHSAILSKEIGIQASQANSMIAKQLKEFRNEKVTKAQVQSKLAWLKMQGKMEEHDEYEHRATEALRRKADERKESGKFTRRECWQAKKAAKKQARAERKAAKKGRV